MDLKRNFSVPKVAQVIIFITSNHIITKFEFWTSSCVSKQNFQIRAHLFMVGTRYTNFTWRLTVLKYWKIQFQRNTQKKLPGERIKKKQELQLKKNTT